MKARIDICAVVFAAGLLTALAQPAEPSAGTTPTVPAATNEIAAPAPAPAAPRKPKPQAVAPAAQPAAPVAAPPVATNVIAPERAAESNAEPAAGEAALSETNPAEPPLDTTTPESSGFNHTLIWAAGAGALVVVASLVIFLLRRPGKTDHVSLITRAMSESKDDERPEDK